jgi:hypothetical protein
MLIKWFGYCTRRLRLFLAPYVVVTSCHMEHVP